ncbi:hypothetical protein M7I_7796 [Glarea lozoyensis 74030]|uniref:Uncharacterized protein n=1 Tax=Glarea lozoyensis (strain ATCC 74030 / MF5533) TaxID=1104152 RepID=H0EY98_GLAL7|nr:hypothetical protein M7I_7796 [Glarea lozoyensis 74030]
MSTKPLTPAQLNSWEPMVQRSKNSCPAKFNSTTAAQPASLSLASKTLTRRPEDTKTTDQQSRPAYGSSEWAQSLEEIDRLEQQTEALTNRIEDVLQTEIQKLKSSMQKDSQDIYGERVNQVESAKAKILEKFRQPEKRRSSGYTVAAWDGPRSLTEVVKNKDQAEPTKLSVISSETERQQLAASKDRSAKSAHANRKETIFEMSQQQAEKNRLERLEYQRMYQPKLAEAGAGVSEIERLKDLGMEIKMYANNPDVYRVKMRNIQVKSRVCVGDRMETEESQAKQPQREDVNQALGQKRLRPVKTLDSDDTDDMQSSSEARGFKKYQKRGADDSPKTANKGAERNENRERQSQNHACMPMIFLPNIRPPASSAELDRDLYIHAKLAESCRKDQEAQFGTSFYSAAAAPNVDTTKLSLDEKIERLVQLRCQQHVYRPELHREEVQRLRRDMRDKYIGMEAPKKMAGPSEYQKLQVLAKKLLQKYLQRPELFQKENGIAASSTTHSENDIKIDGITDEQVQKMDFMIKKSMKRIFPRPELYQKGYRAASSDTRANMDGASELDDEKIESLAKRLAVNYSLGQKRGRFILPTSSNPRREQVLRDLNRKRNQQIMNAVRSNIQRKRNEMLDVIRSNQRAMARAGIPAYSDDYTDTDWSDYEDMDDVDLTVGSTWGDVCDHAGSYVHSADEIAEADKWAESVGLTVVDGDTKSDIAVSGSVNGDVEDKVLRWKDTYDNSIGEFWYGLADDEDEDLTVSDIEDVEMEEGGDWDMLSRMTVLGRMI